MNIPPSRLTRNKGMNHHQYQTARRNIVGNEFSLRSNPSKVKLYQAGMNNDQKEMEVTSIEPRRESRRLRSCLTDIEIPEDSIESDVCKLKF